jgi:hypothetical protein
MAKFEKIETLFGKHKYPREQLLIVMLTDYLARGVGAIDIRLLNYDIPTEWIPEKIRREKALKHFGKAKEILAEIGVV